jgi:hypothetical protein
VPHLLIKPCNFYSYLSLYSPRCMKCPVQLAILYHVSLVRDTILRDCLLSGNFTPGRERHLNHAIGSLNQTSLYSRLRHAKLGVPPDFCPKKLSLASAEDPYELIRYTVSCSKRRKAEWSVRGTSTMPFENPMTRSEIDPPPALSRSPLCKAEICTLEACSKHARHEIVFLGSDAPAPMRSPSG